MKVPSTKRLEREGIARVEAAFSLIGFLFREQAVHDYGIDAHVEALDGETATGRLLALQIKTGQSYFAETEGADVVFRADDDHIQYWLGHSLPVVVVLCEPHRGRILWQVVTKSTVRSTGLGWKLALPSDSTVDEGSRGRLLDLTTKNVPADRYSVLELRDISVGIAKRYRLKIVLNGEFSKPEIAAVVRQVAAEFKSSRYHRDRETAARWGSSDASIISLFVYLSVEDVRDINWICRCLWVVEDYADELPRPTLEGENIGAGVVAKWSTRYEVTAQLLRRKKSTKEDYVGAAEEVAETLEMIFEGLSEELEREVREPRWNPEAFLRRMSSEVAKLTDRVDALGRVPLECEEMDLKLQSLLSYATNVVAPFLVGSPSPERNKFVERYSIEDFVRTLPQFRYELEKIR